MAKLWRWRYVSDYNGVSIVNSFHAVDRVDSGATELDAHGLADLLDAHFTSSYRNMAPPTQVVERLDVAEVLTPGSTDVPAGYSKAIGSAGTHSPANSNLPLAMCALVNIHTNAAVRSGHGWMFAPPTISTDQLTGGLFVTGGTTYYERVLEFATELADDLTHGTVTVGHVSNVIYSKTRHARGDASYYFDVVSASVSREPAWLRSRLSAP